MPTILGINSDEAKLQDVFKWLKEIERNCWSGVITCSTPTGNTIYFDNSKPGTWIIRFDDEDESPEDDEIIAAEKPSEVRKHTAAHDCWANLAAPNRAIHDRLQA